MPRQSLLVSRGPAGVKGLPTDRRAGNKWDGVRGVIWNRTPQTLRRSRRTHRRFWRAGQTSLPRSGHRGGRCIGWTAATVCPCSWLRTLHVKAAAWTRTGNTGPLREEKENVDTGNASWLQLHVWVIQHSKLRPHWKIIFRVKSSFHTGVPSVWFQLRNIVCPWLAYLSRNQDFF